MEITMTWLFGIITTCVCGFITWSLKELYTRLTDTTKNFDKRLSDATTSFETKISKIEEKLPEKYVYKEDFQREMNKLDAKMDSIRKDISEMNRNVASLIAMQTK